jgi:AcrR family transcriptional regulator
MNSPPPKPRARVRRYRGQSLEKRQLQRRGQLLQAALELFGSSGFRAATVRDICAQAGLTERYFYESFPNREALFEAVYAHEFDRMHRDILLALEQAPTELMAQIQAGLGAYLQFIRDQPLAARVLLIEILEVGAGIRGQAERVLNDSIELLAPIVSELRRHASAERLNWRLLAAALVGSNQNIATQWILEGYATPYDSVLETASTVYAALLEKLLPRRLA